ncbi:MAG TPA: helix-turn-helix transcriptional regulator, partial [Candidatus Caccousia avistercoris]|nr:helix-turn-helix transcriptional regulator [Candidatus Caccousia avistercoris]
MDIQTADRLVQFRREAGFSQEELATRLGVSRQAVSKWERAESSPDTDNLLALARLYSVSLDELVGHTPAPRQSLDPCREEPEPAPPADMGEAAPFLVEEERMEKLIKWVKFPYPVLVTF